MGDSIFTSFAAVFTALALTLSTPYTANAVTQIASPDFTALTAKFTSENEKKSNATRIPQVENPNKDIKPVTPPELTELTLVTETQEGGQVKVSVKSNVERSSQQNPVTIEDADTFTTLKSCYIVADCVLTVDPNEHANVLAMSGGIKSETVTLSETAPSAQRSMTTDTGYNPLTAEPLNQAAYPVQLFFKDDPDLPDDPTYTNHKAITEYMDGIRTSPVMIYNFDAFQPIIDGLEMYLVDETAGTATVCGLSTPDNRCDYVAVAFKTGGPHTYRAYIADDLPASAESSTIPLSDMTNVQSRSNPIVLERAPWKVDPGIYRYHGIDTFDGGPVYSTGYEGGHAFVETSNKLDPILPDYRGSTRQSIYDFDTPYKEIAHNPKTGQWALIGLDFVPTNAPTVIESYIGIPVYGDPTNPQKVTDIYDVQDKLVGIYGNDNKTTVGATQGAGIQKGGSNLTDPCTQCNYADPVNTYSGEFWDTSSDLENISATSSLEFLKTYSSLNSNVNGPLGYGWTHNYDMKLIPEGTSTVSNSPSLTVKQENGSEAYYTKMPSGEYLTFARTNATLTYDTATSTFTFIRDKKGIFVFNSSGQLISVKDLNNNTLTLTYASNKLTTIVDGKGQTITLTWTGSRITKVANNANREVTYAYSTAGDLKTVTNVTGGAHTYTYISDHRLSTVTNPKGGTLTNTYRADGTTENKRKITSQTDELGRVTTFNSFGSDESPASGEASVTLPNGNTKYQTYTDGRVTKNYHYNDSFQLVESSYTYDNMGNKTSIINPDGSSIINVYDAKGNLVSTTNESNKTTTYEYNALNLETKITDPMGRVTQITYDSAGNVLNTTNGEGKTTTYVYNAAGQPVSQTSPTGNVTTFTYDSKGHRSTMSNGATTITFTNNAAGLPVSTVNAKGDETKTTYNNAGKPLTITDASNATTNFVYDTSSSLISITNAENKVSSSTYDVRNNLTSYTDAKNGTITITYNEMDLPSTITDAKGNITATMTYTAEGKVATDTNALGKITEYTYNWRGQVTQTKLPSGKLYKNTYNLDATLLNEKNPQNYTTSYTYNNAKQLSTVKDSLNNVTTTEYNNNGAVKKVTRADGLSSLTTYDDAGRVATETDEKGNVTTYTYNTAGQVVQTSTQGVIKSMTYDAVGNLTRITDLSDNSHANYTYDNRNLVTNISYSDSTPPISYTYNTLGQRISMNDANGTTTYTYDAVGNVLTATNSNDGAVTYTYDANSNLATIKTPSNKTTTYTYDAADNLTKLNQINAGNISYTYNNDNLLATTTYPSTLKTTNTYNASNRLTGIVTRKGTNTTNLLNYSYAYNNAGLITTQAANGSGLVDSKTYTYDNLNRMDNVTSGTTTTTFNFDAIHNLTTKSNNDVLTYNNRSQVTGLDNTTTGTNIDYAYDVRGNRTSKTSTTGTTATVQASYISDAANRLIEANLTSPSSTATNVKYGYNGDGVRMKKTINNSTATAEKYVWNNNTETPLLLEDKTYTYLYGVDNAPVAQIKKSDNTVTYLHTDQLGSVRATSNSTGVIGEQYLYDEYGQTVGGATAHNATSFGYAGEYLDKDLGFYYLRARWYDPQTAQFISTDPYSLLTKLQYSYVSGNPLSYTDPTGLFPEGMDFFNPTKYTANDFNVSKWTADDWGVAGTAVGLAALAIGLFPVAAPVAAVVGVVGIGMGLVGGIMSFADGDWGSGLLGVAGAIPGLGVGAKILKNMNKVKRLRAANPAGAPNTQQINDLDAIILSDKNAVKNADKYMTPAGVVDTTRSQVFSTTNCDSLIHKTETIVGAGIDTGKNIFNAGKTLAETIKAAR